MNRYQGYEKAVYDWLMEKHKNDSDFTFSLRQMANKGAETDYFIGTEKSHYFATTFWYIPVAYPGNANELISVIFKLPEHGYDYSFQFLQRKAAHKEQNLSGLQLIRKLKPKIKSTFPNFFEAKEGSKMEAYGFNSPKSNYKSINDLLQDFDNELETLIPIVNKEIENVQNGNKEFVAHRYSKQEFETMIEKLEKRRVQYAHLKDNPIDAKEKEKVNQEDEKKMDCRIPLNQILFGPPGTGKTYNTIDKSLEIVNEKFYSTNKNNRKELTQKFNELLIKDFEKQEGQIAFCTFHQNAQDETN